MFTIARRLFWKDIGFPARAQRVKLILEKVRAPFGKGDKEKIILQMVVISPEKGVIINLKRSLEVGRAIRIKISGGSDHGCSIYGGKC